MKNNSFLSGPAYDRSIAVLPFVNMSADSDNEYFSDGITEEIINALTKIRGLRVIARTSSFAFKGKHLDVRTIGHQLGVSTILEGSVRKAESRVRVTAQLINAIDGTHFWSKTFTRELKDIFELQDEISLRIANQIREHSGHFFIQEHLVNESTHSVKAYELFLRGRYHQLKWEPDSIRTAIEYYEAAIGQDPRFARAYYGNLQCFGLLAAWGYMPAEEGFSKAIENFQIAKDIDTRLPEYFLSFVGRSFWGEWNFQSAYEHILQALKTYPHHSDMLEAMTELLIANGYLKEAENYIQKALANDPLSANHHYTLANIYYMKREYETALTHLERSLSINPKFVLAGELKFMCLIWLNKRKAFNRFVEGRQDVKLQTMLFDVINKPGTTVSDALAQAWEKAAEDQNQLVPYELYILANSDRRQDALKLLAKYVSKKRGQIINFRHEPFLEELRQFDQFHQLHISDFRLQGKTEPGKSMVIENNSDAPELESQKELLLHHIEKHKSYLNSQLSLSDLAKAVNLHPNRLSYLINIRTGMNFSEFINRYRLEYFKKIALDKKFSHLTILSLAYESGFNSKTVFNAYFKKMEGITPRVWLKSVKQTRK